MSSETRQIRICQNRTCRKQGAKKVLQAFTANPVKGVTVSACGCLGACGNGPMVVVLPDNVWYCGVRSHDVAIIIKSHLQLNQPVATMVYSR